LTGKRKTLDFPIEIKGTDFQVAVYEGIREIPFGTVWTYKEVAVAIGRPNAQRAVGGALNKNPLSLIVPCHRVIGANGKLVGFGSGLPLKKALLKLEGTI
jgi:O-6-methylguanine DNA methyltransferase